MQKSKGVYQNHLKKLKNQAAQKVMDNAVPFAILATTLFWLAYWMILVDQKCK